MKQKALRIIALILVISTMLSAPAFADMHNSNFIHSYGGYVYSAGNGVIQVYVNVVGKRVSDEIGATTVILKESTDQSTWTTVAVFHSYDYSNMMAYNTLTHDFHVDYSNGVSGRYYYATVNIWVGYGGNGDSRYFYTQVIQA